MALVLRFLIVLLDTRADVNSLGRHHDTARSRPTMELYVAQPSLVISPLFPFLFSNFLFFFINI